MKKLILLELTLLFLATTFQSHNPPGWYQQQLPVNVFVDDIFFLDSLNGWVITNATQLTDTAYVIRTSDGGANWEINYLTSSLFTSIQFLNLNTGFICGAAPGAAVWKTTTMGYSWDQIANFGLGFGLEDIQFLDQNTGWVSSKHFKRGGIWKTIDGGNNWTKQLNGSPSVQIRAINILNQDTGWAISSTLNTDLYRTTNGGINWNTQYTLGGFSNDVFFLNKNYGVISGGINRRTTNGGFNWISSTQNVGGAELDINTDSIGWAGADFNKISKTTNGGKDWYYQNSPTFSNISISIFDTLKGWAAGTGVVKTTNGGIQTSIESNSTEIPKMFLLYQNYPNPFNPVTVISYELQITSYVILKVFDIQGKEIKKLVNQRQNSGSYKVEFDGSGLNSGIYFYRIEISDERSSKKFSETKTMILLK